jgi:hypothetical protein
VQRDGAWFEPVFVLRFRDDSLWGQPYWAVRSGPHDAIFGARDLEMRLDPSPVQLTWLSARVAARRPEASLHYTLMSSHGEFIREGTLLPPTSRRRGRPATAAPSIRRSSRSTTASTS